MGQIGSNLFRFVKISRNSSKLLHIVLNGSKWISMTPPYWNKQMNAKRNKQRTKKNPSKLTNKYQNKQTNINKWKPKQTKKPQNKWIKQICNSYIYIIMGKNISKWKLVLLFYHNMYKLVHVSPSLIKWVWSCQFWSKMVQHGPKLSKMAQYGIMWSNMV